MAAPSTRNILPLLKISVEKAGSATTAFVGSALDAATFDESGAATGSRAASGSYVHERTRTGSGVTEFTAGGTSVRVYQKAGIGVRGSAAGGVSAGQKTFTKGGKGVLGQPTYVLAGAAATERVGSGGKVREKPPKTGKAVTVFTASGRKSLFTTGGAGVLTTTASGLHNGEYIRTGGNMVPPYGTPGYGEAEYGGGPYAGGFRNDGRRIASGVSVWIEAKPGNVTFTDDFSGIADVRIVEVVP
jgi:hypothetical protein